MKQGLSAIALMTLMVACGATQEVRTGSPTIPTEGVDALVADLQRAGAAASRQGTFAPDPFPGQGILLCVDREPVRVYLYPSAADRATVTVHINPNDPSNIGSAMVEWVGSPRFWQRDRIVVLYFGPSQAMEALLTAVLGRPFAHGQGAGGRAGQSETCA